MQNVLPEKFNSVEIKFTDIDGKEEHVVQDLKEALEVKDLEIPIEIADKMNKAPSMYAYWGRIEASLIAKKAKLDGEFQAWLNGKIYAANFVKGESSEAAKERKIMVEFAAEYEAFQKEMRKVDYYLGLATVAREAFKRLCNLLPSVGTIMRGEMELDSIRTREQRAQKGSGDLNEKE